MIYSLPFAYQPLKAAFVKVDKRLVESAYVLGLSPISTFFRVIVPSSVSGFVASAILVFVHTLGEFGVILMVGGSIPGRTKVVSIAIYEAVETLQYREALMLYAQVAGGDPHSAPWAMLQIAYTQEEAGQQEKAIMAFQQVCKRFPKDSHASRAHAHLQSQYNISVTLGGAKE